jgi:hypothetical protein
MTQSVLSAMSVRRVLRPLDETICMATALRLDVAALVKLLEPRSPPPVEKLMEAFLLLFPTIPPNILFAYALG